MPPTLTIAPPTARRFLALRHYLAPPRSLPGGSGGDPRVFERFGSIQFDPLEVAGRNTTSFPSPASPATAASWTDALLYERADPLRDLQQGAEPRTQRRPALVPDHMGSQPRRNNADGVFDKGTPPARRGACSSGSAPTAILSSTDIAPRAAIDWYWRPTNQVRAILEALAPGRRSWGSPGARATAGSTTWSSDCSRPTSSPRAATGARATPLQASFALPRSRPPWGRAAKQEVWLGTGGQAAKFRRERRHRIARGRRNQPGDG